MIQDSATQWTQTDPCDTKTSGDGKEFTKVFRPVGKAESHVQRQFIGIWVILWGLIMESSYVCNPSILGKKYCWKIGTPNKWRDVCSIVATWLGWKMVGWLSGMLLLSSKCPRHLGRWENIFWMSIWRIIQWFGHSVWRNGWISSYLRERAVTAPSICSEICSSNIHLICTLRGGNLERRYFGRKRGGAGNFDPSEVRARRLNAKEIITSQSGEHFIVLIADDTEQLERSEDFRGTFNEVRRSLYQ